LDWDVPGIHGLVFDGRVVETASQYADTANTQSVPAWWRADFGARYSVPVWKSVLTVRARVENITDRNEWTSVGGFPGAGYLVLGEPRTWLLEATVAF
jgi:iron complex outermembrane receptor protein